MAKDNTGKQWLANFARRHGVNANTSPAQPAPAGAPATPPRQTINMPAENVSPPRAQTVNMPAENVPPPAAPAAQTIDMEPVTVRGNAPGPAANSLAGGASGNRAAPPANNTGNTAGAGAADGAPTVVSSGEKHTLKFPKIEIPVNQSIANTPLKLDKIEFSAEIEVEIAGQTAPTVNDTVRAGATGRAASGLPAGVQAELAHRWVSARTRLLGEISVQSRARAEVRTDGGYIGLDLLHVNSALGTFTARFNLMERSSSGVQFAVTHLQRQIPLNSQEFAQPGVGQVKAKFKVTVDVKIVADPARIAQWFEAEVAPRLAGVAEAVGTIALPLLVGAAHAALFIAAARSGERTAEAALWAQTYARGYIRGYTQTMTGQNEPAGHGPGYTGGFAHGQQDGNRQLSALRSQGHTDTSIHNAASRNYDELRRRVFQTIRDHCIHAGIEMAGAMNLPMQPRVIEAAVDHERP